MRVSNKKLALLNRSAISTAVLLAIYGGPIGIAQAQQNEGAQEAQAGANGSAIAADGTVNKVIVTARRRAELIQDVPGAVTAFSGAELEKRALPDLTAIATSPRIPR